MTLGDYGSVASILSLLITILVFLRLRQIHRHYQRHVLLPRFMQQLEGFRDLITSAIVAKHPENLKTALERCDAILERLAEHSDKTLSRRIAQHRTRVKEALFEQEEILMNKSKSLKSGLEALIESAYSYRRADQWKKP